VPTSTFTDRLKSAWKTREVRTVSTTRFIAAIGRYA
jgi:hypothetical protein